MKLTFIKVVKIKKIKLIKLKFRFSSVGLVKKQGNDQHAFLTTNSVINKDSTLKAKATTYFKAKPRPHLHKAKDVKKFLL